ncbi:MAG TPA: PEP-CTERM sorting domain-containing protein, partial [Stellaceae bacterium]
KFKLAGFGPFSGLGAGQRNGLEVDLDTMLKGLKAGQLVEDILLTWHGENGSGYVGPVEQLKLRLTATMVAEPATLAILGVGAFGLFAVRRRRRAA